MDPVTADVNTHRDLEQDHRRRVEDAERGLKQNYMNNFNPMLWISQYV